MSHGLLADSVDTSLASLLCSCKTDAVLSEVHEQWVSRERREQLTRCLSAVAELLVISRQINVLTITNRTCAPVNGLDQFFEEKNI